MVFCLFPDTPPEKANAKGGKGASQTLYLNAQGNPNEFGLGLKDAACTDPGCCCIASLGAPCGFTACWARKAVLEKYDGGLANYVCFQNYIPTCCKYCAPTRGRPQPAPHMCMYKAYCTFIAPIHAHSQSLPRSHPSAGCMDTSNKCKGNQVALCLEGACCPVFSLSIARIHMMDKKQIRPDPCDYQIIACSNFLQLISCVLDLIATFVEQLREASLILDCIADCFTLSVAGCMGAQIKHEISKDEAVTVVMGQPVGGQGGAPPVPHEMTR